MLAPRATFPALLCVLSGLALDMRAIAATAGPAVSTLTDHQAWVRTVAYSPDGRHLATGGDDKTIKLWDLANAWRLNGRP